MSQPIESYDLALDAIRDVFGDQSVSQSETKRNLQGLIDEIAIMIGTLKDDDEEQG